MTTILIIKIFNKIFLKMKTSYNLMINNNKTLIIKTNKFNLINKKIK